MPFLSSFDFPFSRVLLSLDLSRSRAWSASGVRLAVAEKPLRVLKPEPLRPDSGSVVGGDLSGTVGLA